jgi:hypothetical protein
MLKTRLSYFHLLSQFHRIQESLQVPQRRNQHQKDLRFQSFQWLQWFQSFQWLQWFQSFQWLQ